MVVLNKIIKIIVCNFGFKNISEAFKTTITDRGFLHKKTHVDDYVNIKDYFDKYFGNDIILTIFFFKIIILDLNFLVFFSTKKTHVYDTRI